MAAWGRSLSEIRLAESAPKDFLSIAEWPRDEIERMLSRAAELKDLRRRRIRVSSLDGCSILLYFAKPSLRTFVTFEVGVVELGGYPVYLPPGQVQIGEREPPEDVARNLSRWCHAIVARTYSHEVIESLAAHASVPVVNALTDLLHPCQAMADALTIAEHGDLRRDELCYIGDGNNMCHSLLNLAGCLGMRLVVCTPKDYAPDAGILARASGLAAHNGGQIRLVSEPSEAVQGASFIYTDVLDQHGPGGRGGGAQGRVSTVSGERGALRGRAVARQAPALPAGAPRRRGHRGRLRVRARDRLRSGREPPARAEGDLGAPDLALIAGNATASPIAAMGDPRSQLRCEPPR